MRKIILLFCILFTNTILLAQTNFYQELFDNYDSGLDGATSVTSDQLFFYYNVSGRMEAQLLMYENTGDIKYLRIFLTNANRVLNRRDDNRDFVTKPTSEGFSNISSYNLQANPTWSTKRYNSDCPRYDGFGGDTKWHTKSDNYLTCPESVCIEIPHLIGNANIIYSFVKFYNIVKANSALHTEMFNFYTQSEMHPENFLVIANDLLAAAEETFDFFESNWDATYNAYREHLETGSYLQVPLDYKGARLPLNMQASMARVVVQLHKAKIGTLKENFYYNRLNDMATYLDLAMKYIPATDSKRWHYWGYNNPKPNGFDDEGDAEFEDPLRENDPLREDISHSALTAAFPYECYENGYTNFSLTDIQQIANTLKNVIYEDVLILNDGINTGLSSIGQWNFKIDTNSYGSSDPAPTRFLYSYWMKYAETDPEIYQMLNDFNTSKYYPPVAATDQWSRNLERPLTVAYLHKMQRIFAPIAANHAWGASSDWAGVAGGNFDDDPEDEFVYLRNNDGIFRMAEYVDTKTFQNKAWGTMYEGSTSSTGTQNWANFAAGDFLDDDKDEIIAVSNDPNYNGYYVFSVNGNAINQEEYGLGWGVDSDWVGAAAGDLMSGGKDEFVLARNYNLQLLLYTYDSGVRVAKPAVNLHLDYNVPRGSKIAGIAVGNVIDSKAGDELVVLVNSLDIAYNGFYVFSIDSTGSYTLEFKDTGWETNSDWTSITIGNFEASTKDQIVAHRNLDSEYKLFTVNETSLLNSLEFITSEIFTSAQVENNIFASGNFCVDDLDFDVSTDNGNINDELIVLRNTDAGIIMYAHTTITNGTSSRQTVADTGIFTTNEALTNDDINIYPNPTKGNLTIDVTKDIANIHINNLFGQTIQSNIKKNTIDISSLTKGVYILTVEFTNGNTITKKIIKN
jgi:hypothetical protein